jgi:hypothetical protein
MFEFMQVRKLLPLASLPLAGLLLRPQART